MSLVNKIMNGDVQIAVDTKAGGPAGAIIPQENITGDVLRGYGPRRGNLERLLRYWRPIMRKPGGFRRCRVILANHPELYPLERICAWLHHETTGLWTNEGCHHPGMKNCRKKMRGVVRGSLYSDREFNNRMRKLTSRSGRKAVEFTGIRSVDEPFSPVITQDDWTHAVKVLQDFIDMEPDFVKYVEDDNNWEHVDGYVIDKNELESLDANNIEF
jgi:hypothetical protein